VPDRPPVSKAIRYAALGGALVGALSIRLTRANRADFLTKFPWLAFDPVFHPYTPFLIACFGGLVAFNVYWEIASKNAAGHARSESSLSRAVHVTLVNLAMLLVLPIIGMGRFMPPNPLIMAAGLAIEFAGIFLAVWARLHLGGNWSGRVAINEEHELIRTGPYRRLRHPIYTGILGMYVGPAIVTGEWLALIGVLLALVAYWRKIRIEETALDAHFGAQYEDYRRDSWALLPGLF
jgi:protein-S-isoprenylcysteine O-methyltransferase Ste14